MVEESLANIGATIMGRKMFPTLLGTDLHGLELVPTVATPKVTLLKFARHGMPGREAR